MNTKILIPALVMIFSLMGCEKSPSTTHASTSNASTTVATDTADPNLPKYVMAVAANYAPFAFKDEKGLPIGFDIDIINAIGKKQGFRVDIINDQWDGIFNGLDNNTRDLVGSGVVATSENASKYNFSNPYLIAPLSAVVLASNTSINSFDDLKTKKVGVEEATSNKTAFEQFMNGHATNIVPLSSSFVAFQEVIRGNIDANFDNSLLNQYYINTYSKKANLSFKTFQIPNREPDRIVFAIKKGRDDLTKKINDGLVQIKQDGTYDQIYKKWFGDTPQVISSASQPASTSNTPTSSPGVTK